MDAYVSYYIWFAPDGRSLPRCQNPIAPYVLCSGVSLLSCIVVMIGCLTAPGGRIFGSAFSRLICLVVHLYVAFYPFLGSWWSPLICFFGMGWSHQASYKFSSQLAATFSGKTATCFIMFQLPTMCWKWRLMYVSLYICVYIYNLCIYEWIIELLYHSHPFLVICGSDPVWKVLLITWSQTASEQCPKLPLSKEVGKQSSELRTNRIVRPYIT